MPQFPAPKPRPDWGYVADMLGQIERLSARAPFLAYLVGMARREAEDVLRGQRKA